MAEETPRSASREGAGVEAAARPAAAAPRDAAGDAPSAIGAIAANAAAGRRQHPPQTQRHRPAPRLRGRQKTAAHIRRLGAQRLIALLGFIALRCASGLSRAISSEVAPNWQAAQGIAAYGWWAIGGAIASIAASSSRHVHASGGVPHGVEHAQANHRAPHAPAARLFRLRTQPASCAA